MEQNPVDQVPRLVRDLYKIVGELEDLFKEENRRFTPDGHLVGSIGEVLAAYYYGLKLLPSSTPVHDAETQDGKKKVQIKATQVRSIGIRKEPEHLLVLKLFPDGSFEEVFNGPGKLAWQKAGDRQKNDQRPISLTTLKRLMKDVSEKDRLKRVKP